MFRRIMAVLLCLGIFCQAAWAGAYEDGAEAQKNRRYSEAMQFYQQAIKESDDARAINAIGTMYELGTGVKQNYKKAFEYYEDAAVKGNTKAYGNVAALFERGLGVKKDKGRALMVYCQAMNRGDGKSINNLGMMVSTGDIFPENISVGWALFAYAADKGDLVAPGNLKKMQPYMTKSEIAEAKKIYAALKKSKDPVETMYQALGIPE